MKGLEALAVESLLAARRYGAEDAVIESLAATYPRLGWEDSLPDYLIGRVAEHGERRGAEMREVAKALRAVGLKPTMALAIAERQESLVRQMAVKKVRLEPSFSWCSLADTIRSDGSRSESKPNRSRTNARRKATR